MATDAARLNNFCGVEFAVPSPSQTLSSSCFSMYGAAAASAFNHSSFFNPMGSSAIAALASSPALLGDSNGFSSSPFVYPAQVPSPYGSASTSRLVSPTYSSAPFGNALSSPFVSSFATPQTSLVMPPSSLALGHGPIDSSLGSNGNVNPSGGWGGGNICANEEGVSQCSEVIGNSYPSSPTSHGSISYEMLQLSNPPSVVFPSSAAARSFLFNPLHHGAFPLSGGAIPVGGDSSWSPAPYVLSSTPILTTAAAAAMSGGSSSLEDNSPSAASFFSTASKGGSPLQSPILSIPSSIADGKLENEIWRGSLAALQPLQRQNGGEASTSGGGGEGEDGEHGGVDDFSGSSSLSESSSSQTNMNNGASDCGSSHDHSALNKSIDFRESATIIPSNNYFFSMPEDLRSSAIEESSDESNVGTIPPPVSSTPLFEFDPFTGRGSGMVPPNLIQPRPGQRYIDEAGNVYEYVLEDEDVDYERVKTTAEEDGEWPTVSGTTLRDSNDTTNGRRTGNDESSSESVDTVGETNHVVVAEQRQPVGGRGARKRKRGREIEEGERNSSESVLEGSSSKYSSVGSYEERQHNFSAPNLLMDKKLMQEVWLETSCPFILEGNNTHENITTTARSRRERRSDDDVGCITTTSAAVGDFQDAMKSTTSGRSTPFSSSSAYASSSSSNCHSHCSGHPGVGGGGGGGRIEQSLRLKSETSPSEIERRAFEQIGPIGQRDGSSTILSFPIKSKEKVVSQFQRNLSTLMTSTPDSLPSVEELPPSKTSKASPPSKRKGKSDGGGNKGAPRTSTNPGSGYPGVSWNSRMQAWLAFYVDLDGTRRSHTFKCAKLGGMEVARVLAVDWLIKKQADIRIANNSVVRLSKKNFS